VILDDATSEIYYAQLVEEESTLTVMAGVCEVIGRKGLFCALYSDRASHFWHAPKAGGKVDPHQLTQLGRALRELGVTMIPAYSPQARGRSERSFGTWQGRLPQELRLHGITTRTAQPEASSLPRRIQCLHSHLSRSSDGGWGRDSSTTRKAAHSGQPFPHEQSVSAGLSHPQPRSSQQSAKAEPRIVYRPDQAARAR
jgi:hypothetical protein